MNFDQTEEQQLLGDSLRKFLAKDYDFERRKKIVASATGWSEPVWATFAEMGLTSLPFATDLGGFGGGAVDMMAVMEAIGEAMVVEPYLPTVGLAGRLVERTGSEAQKKAIVPGVIEGRTRLAFAHTEREARYNPAHVSATAKKAGTGWTLDGEKCVVLGAAAASHLVVSARTAGKTADTAGISLFLVEREAAGVVLKAYRTLDEQRAADVILTGVKVDAGALLGDEGQSYDAIEEALDFATALLCSEAVGAMKSANDATLEYLKTRKQFGAPIGTFQALQHRMVDMFVALEQSRSMACLAASKADGATSQSDRMRAISAAKIRIADACRLVSQEAVQLHGGMGMTEELKVSHTFRRLTMIAQQFGDADHHLERFAALG